MPFLNFPHLNKFVITAFLGLFGFVRLGSIQPIICVDECVDEEERHQAGRLEVAMEVDGGVVGQMRRAEVKIPGHVRFFLIYI